MKRRPAAVTRTLLQRWPLPDSLATGSKEERGRALVIAGSSEVAGAAVLAATAVLRAGAGKVAIATVASLAAHIGTAMPEARVIGLTANPDGEIGSLGRALIADATAADAVLMGPGMRPSAATLRSMRKLVGACAQPMVLDAGALACSDSRHRGPLMITPHAGEMARLLGVTHTEVSRNALAVARAVARERDVVVVLKGVETHVVNADGEAWRHVGGGPGLGTSGSGDVLAGIAAGLLARGALPDQAMVWAVWLHAEAGRRLARRIGTVGFLAREIAQEVPAALAL